MSGEDRLETRFFWIPQLRRAVGLTKAGPCGINGRRYRITIELYSKSGECVWYVIDLNQPVTSTTKTALDRSRGRERSNLFLSVSTDLIRELEAGDQQLQFPAGAFIQQCYTSPFQRGFDDLSQRVSRLDPI